MTQDLVRYLGDLVVLVQDRYNQSLQECHTENDVSTDFVKGANLAYYEVLDLVRNQLIAFGYDLDAFGPIVPIMGRPIVRPSSNLE